MKTADKHDGEMSLSGRKQWTAAELINAIEHGVNRELKFYLSLPACECSRIREHAVTEAVGKVSSDGTYEEVIAVCRSIVRRLLTEHTNAIYLQTDEDGDSKEASAERFGCNGHVPGASQLRPTTRPTNRNWAEDEAIVRIDTRSLLGRCAAHLGQPLWDWFQRYALADRKPKDASERMRFSRMKRRLLEMDI